MANRYISEIFKSGEEFEDFLQKLDAFKKGVESGDIVIPKAMQATIDANGDNIASTYAKKSALEDGSLVPAKATAADSATKATQDADGNVISNIYAKKSALEDGSLVPKKATEADSATKATQDADGNVISNIYAKKSALEDGSLIPKKATEAESAGSATKATRDADGKDIRDTYAKKSALLDGSIIPQKATSAYSATTAGSATSANSAKVLKSTTELTSDADGFIVKETGIYVVIGSTGTTYVSTIIAIPDLKLYAYTSTGATDPKLVASYGLVFDESGALTSNWRLDISGSSSSVTPYKAYKIADL